MRLSISILSLLVISWQSILGQNDILKITLKKYTGMVTEKPRYRVINPEKIHDTNYTIPFLPFRYFKFRNLTFKTDDIFFKMPVLLGEDTTGQLVVAIDKNRNQDF